MEVPFVEGVPFRWMKEGICITQSYDWSKASNYWYVTPTDATQLVPRAAGSTY